MAAVAKTLESSDLGSRFIKVDHAGEHGAVCIYAGQIFMARLTAPDLVAELRRYALTRSCRESIHASR